MRALIAGSRTFTDYELLKTRMDQYSRFFDITSVISGMARGADYAGRRWAIENNIPVEAFPADWEQHGKSAGYIRNKAMAEVSEVAFLFWDGESKGTRHMMQCLTGKQCLIEYFKA